jgi:ubiquinone/menaquinone biosynthesis C-methylase UbiE
VNRVANIESERLASSQYESSDPSAVSVAEGYERWAPTYDRDPNPLLAREERYLLPLLGVLRGKRILDLACGTGRWLEKLTASGAGLGVGVDCSTAMLRVARNKYSIATRLARSACEKLPFHEAAFDLAICSFALGHIQNLQGAMRELARVVEPGGDVLISDLHPEAHSRGWRVGFRDSNAAVEIEVLPRTIEEIIQAFCAEGFACVTHVSLWLGEAERPVFVRAGKAQIFAEASRVPAVFVCHFRHLGASIDNRLNPLAARSI